MGITDQFKKILDNWLIILIFIIGFLMLNTGGISTFGKMASYDMVAENSLAYGGTRMYQDDGFAPNVEERVITKTASLSTEVERGTYKEEESKLKAILKSSESFLLNENVNQYGREGHKYYSGYYQIKVETQKYDAVLPQIKAIGKVQSFNENAQDITGSYTNAEIELEAEKSRLIKFQEMYEKSDKVTDQIELTDRIFNQERTIKYLEERIENMDNRVDYTTISFSMVEKQSEYANIIWVKFSTLLNTFVDSVNTLFRAVFALFPWFIVFLMGLLIYKKFKK